MMVNSYVILSSTIASADFACDVQLEVKLATQKRDRDSTYVGDRPNFGRRNYDQGGRGGGNFNNNGAYNNGPNDMGGMGMGNMSNMGGGMGGMGGMGMGGQGGQGAFDPYAMAQFFKQVYHAVISFRCDR